MQECMEGDADTLRFLLAADPSLVHKRFERLVSLLHVASWSGHPSVVEELLCRTADVNSRSEDAATPLYYGVYAEDESLRDQILNNNISGIKKSSGGRRDAPKSKCRN